jgi:hypothetical protein
MSCKIFVEAKEKVLTYVENGDYSAMLIISCILTSTHINFIFWFVLLY